MISIIICNIEPAKWKSITQMYGALLKNHPHEFIGIHDAKSMCDGYQRGLKQSKGDLLIFSHDDIEFLTPDFAERLRGYLQRYDLIGVAGTSRLMGAGWIQSGHPYVFGQVAHLDLEGKGYNISIFGTHAPVVEGIQAVDGLFLACHRAVAEKVNWDVATFTGWHCYDVDFSFRAHRAGYRLAVCNDLLPIHASGGTYGNQWQESARKFNEKFRGQLAPGPARPFQFTAIVVPAKRDVVEVMTPAYWGRPSAPPFVGASISTRW